MGCHQTVAPGGRGAEVTVALAGNPNVGKSSVFNYLTGLEATTANYPGKTVELGHGVTTIDGAAVALIDLPGTYTLGAVSEDQWLARRAVLDGQPDAVLAVVDATNLARNLYLVLQLMDLGLPVVVALNLVDEAERRGLAVDSERLAEALQTTVVRTVATRGCGLKEALRAAVAQARRPGDHHPPRYGEPIDRALDDLTSRLAALSGGELPKALSARALAVFLLEEDSDVAAVVGRERWGEAALRAAREVSRGLLESTGEPASLLIARGRHELAARLAERAQSGRADQPKARPSDHFLKLTTSLSTGVPILVAVLAATFAFLFFVGNALATAFDEAWGAAASPLIQGALTFLFGEGVVTRTLLWGLDAGVQAALGIGIPYILTFYFLLALLEDSGYLSSAAFLTDQAMRRLGLHGRAIIPLVAGAGCNVPAIMGTRVLTTMRERTIASALIVLVPCSARTAVILGAVSLFLGWQPAVALFGLMAALIALVGLGLNRVMPGKPGGLVIEMFPFRWPHLATTAKKTWSRFKEFVFVAMPVILVGSLALGALYETGAIWALAAPMAPVIQGWLGLPAIAGLTLLFAVLRKELALQLLVTLAIAQYGTGASDLLSFLSPRQIFVYALVNTIYIPCIATVAALGRELGWRRSLAVMAFTIGLALALGGLVDRTLQVTGWL